MNPFIAIAFYPIIYDSIPFRGRKRDFIDQDDGSFICVDDFSKVPDEFLDPEYLKGGADDEQEIRTTTKIGGNEGCYIVG